MSRDSLFHVCELRQIGLFMVMIMFPSSSLVFHPPSAMIVVALSFFVFLRLFSLFLMISPIYRKCIGLNTRVGFLLICRNTTITNDRQQPQITKVTETTSMRRNRRTNKASAFVLFFQALCRLDDYRWNTSRVDALHYIALCCILQQL